MTTRQAYFQIFYIQTIGDREFCQLQRLFGTVFSVSLVSPSLTVSACCLKLFSQGALTLQCADCINYLGLRSSSFTIACPCRAVLATFKSIRSSTDHHHRRHMCIHGTTVPNFHYLPSRRQIVKIGHCFLASFNSTQLKFNRKGSLKG